ncbi:MAG TPA: hypothetical protein VFM09_12545 [Marmoricola sp.]|nr:hypothetical protein [Marmoricola sp.]
METTTRTISIRRAAASSSTFALLLGASVLAPLLGLPQLFTGSIVNAALLIATVVLGPRAAISIGILPSLFAVMSGQLPGPLAPLVPLIMLGNALLVVVFHALRSRGYWVGAVTAAVAKAGWLFVTAGVLVAAAGLLPQPVVAVALTMMGWPQLVTALAGGLIAFAVLRPARRL